MRTLFALTLSRRLALIVGLSLPGVAIAQDPNIGGQGLAILTPPMTCYFDSTILYGSYAIEKHGSREFRFQLREDGILLVNGHEVKPLRSKLIGTNSWAAIDVGAIVVDPKEAAMLQLLPPDQKRQFQDMASGRGIMMTGGLVRFIQISFSDSSVVLSSIIDGKEVDIMSDRCH
ncbi:hypothetical protein [Ciceribacter selenitireducens]|uniref:hypothetical protein n=1 Tax=Ciceribacter selenitireducens TaxID=448181 RepID=UPI000E20500A|nr:hypothetical protein [Ciceribacter selenitireducens]